MAITIDPLKELVVSIPTHDQSLTYLSPMTEASLLCNLADLETDAKSADLAADAFDTLASTSKNTFWLLSCVFVWYRIKLWCAIFHRRNDEHTPLQF